MFRARVAEQSGTLTMSTGSDAKHLLCVKPEGATGSRKPVVFSLVLKLGHSDGYYEEMAASEHLDRLQLEVRILTLTCLRCTLDLKNLRLLCFAFVLFSLFFSGGAVNGLASANPGRS